VAASAAAALAALGIFSAPAEVFSIQHSPSGAFGEPNRAACWPALQYAGCAADEPRATYDRTHLQRLASEHATIF
jgi:hypothetical protein